MKYNVEVRDETGIFDYIDNLSKKAAIEAAKRKAQEIKRGLVFISWYRKSDGQVGYLNPDGNHDITGRAW